MCHTVFFPLFTLCHYCQPLAGLRSTKNDAKRGFEHCRLALLIAGGLWAFLGFACRCSLLSFDEVDDQIAPIVSLQKYERHRRACIRLSVQG